jgi:exopolysaccharide biosynthesis protein
MQKSEEYELFHLKGHGFACRGQPLLDFKGYLAKFSRIHSIVEVIYCPSAQKLSKMIENHPIIAAINGGFWNKKKKPLDWCVVNFQTITPLTNPNRSCIFITNGIAEIQSAPDLNDVKIPPIKTHKEQSEHILQSGPLLIFKKQIQTNFDDFHVNADQFDSDITLDRHPRSVFGYNGTEWCLLVIEGRSRRSAGLFLEELAQLCADLGMEYAINLDGGASSTLNIKQHLINEPRFSFFRRSCVFSAKVPGHERKIPTAIAIRKKEKKIEPDEL